MADLTPLETLYDVAPGNDLPLPGELARLYGRLSFPSPAGRPVVFANFVETLDGVVAMGGGDKTGGGSVSGFNKHDKMVMGLLRAVADAIVVASGTLRSVPNHVWTAEDIYRPLAAEYQQLRASLGKAEPPLNVFVTGTGEIDPGSRVMQSGEVPVLIVTTQQGARRLGELGLAKQPAVQVAAVTDGERVSAHAVLKAVAQARRSELVLTEGGPQLMADFFAERCLDDLFLTLAPQVAGRDETIERPGLVEGKLLAPERPVWGTLVSLKRAESHLFLRYAFPVENGGER